MTELRFDNRVVVVTGAGAGLGRAYALLFASRGASIVVNDLGGGRHGDGKSSQAADNVVAEIQKNGGKAVADYNSVVDGAKIIKTAINTFGRVDVVVNNAGILKDKSFAKMSEKDWDLIQDVHIKGAFKTTQAAWPYFCKQNYGKVIFTTSNSGLCGNFGQSNYSTAKMGLVGFAKTLAIEGAKKNICINVIVPTAASRLTEDIIPPDLFKELKPELIAPIVFWLCHEKCNETGSVIESAIGWVRKCDIVRSPGCVLRTNLNDIVTPESVQKNWSDIVDMTSAKYAANIEQIVEDQMNIIDNLKNGVSNKKIDDNVLYTNYDSRDSILYALGVGATIENPSDLRYLYENHENFAILPTYYIAFGVMGCMRNSIISNALPDLQINPMNILHGEQYFETYKVLSGEAKVKTVYKILDVLHKKKGIVILVQHDTFDATSEEKLCTGQISVYVVGVNSLQAKTTSPHIIPIIDPPNRNPDASVTQKTTIDQAALYRLNGDPNPLHIDSNLATMAGYKRPILHGLCSLGFSTRHVLNTYANGDPSLFKRIKVRFSKPVFPGETLRTDMWQNGNRIHFQTSIVETNTPIIVGAYIDLFNVKSKVTPTTPTATPTATPTSNLIANNNDLQSNAVFNAMRDYVKANPDQTKKVNAIFLYNITVDGNPKAQWTLDLKKGDVYKGQPKSGKADTTLTTEDKDMMDIATGKVNPQVAFMRGKLKITGNIMLTQKLKTLMEMNKAKL
ncbi:peroxisomal multifunctional enzyme type 2-like [Vespa mandarinia]|uniref:peroxisomal multifunctional enzyme type 2-like n=1 Tax=Vespa mandarinia TaxID=7446 RepID=UPI00160A7732|nr:peroxisomal multifunctional enzyme type 2-like [Vespa mandarinia]